MRSTREASSRPTSKPKTTASHFPLKVRVRTAIKWCWAATLFSLGLFRWAKWRIASRAGIIVLTLHRVLPEEAYARTNSPAGMVLHERTFEGLARYVASQYPAVSLANGDLGWANTRGKPQIALTFDDGWIDTFHAAFPIVQRHGIPTTVFVCPERVGAQSPFWVEQVAALWRVAERIGVTIDLPKLSAAEQQSSAPDQFPTCGKPTVESVIEQLKTLPARERERFMGFMKFLFGADGDATDAMNADATMSWAEITELMIHGVTIGSHTLSHKILTRVSESEARHEITNSKQAIQQKLGRECTLFAYPNGAWSRGVRYAVGQAGYRWGFINEPGVWTCDTDPWLVPRVNIWEGKLVSPFGRFSRVMFEYATFWQAYRASRQGATGTHSQKQAPSSVRSSS